MCWIRMINNEISNISVLLASGRTWLETVLFCLGILILIGGYRAMNESISEKWNQECWPANRLAKFVKRSIAANILCVVLLLCWCFHSQTEVHNELAPIRDTGLTCERGVKIQLGPILSPVIIIIIHLHRCCTHWCRQLGWHFVSILLGCSGSGTATSMSLFR